MEAEIRPFVPDPGNTGVGKRMGSTVAAAKQGEKHTVVCYFPYWFVLHFF